MERANTEENITLILFWLILIGTNAIQDERNIIFNSSQDKSLVNPMYK